jgi:glycosyltransferase involved in cell wall biosynthesis
MNPEGSAPAVSVIIATYNRSEVLRYAITSVLRQEWTNLELLVIGDCCTDDTAAVVGSFADPRLIWDNLPSNCGSQYGPNNRGLELARGRYIAYLGHDDLWHPSHLANLVTAIESSDADLVYSLTLDVGPPANPTRHLMGVSADGSHSWDTWAPPSSWLHRRELVLRVGGWRDYRTIELPVDVEFIARATDAGARIYPVPELSCFKFTSVTRSKSYQVRHAEEQARWWERIQTESDLRLNELLLAFQQAVRRHPDLVQRFHLPSRSRPGSVAEAYRARRGLPQLSRGDSPRHEPLYTDRCALKYLNVEDDIVPADARERLHESPELPTDGLFLGFNWHSLELDEAGMRWRWMDGDAQIVVTRPTGRRHRLKLHLSPGPGFRGGHAVLLLRGPDGNILSRHAVMESGDLTLDLGPLAEPGAVFRLDAEGGGHVIAGDPRVLNFRVFEICWS